MPRARVEDGETIFAALGCVSCHVPELVGDEGAVRAYSDFLLHQIADPARYQVDESGVDPREFRTAPLWGLRDTEPYLHDGSAETVRDAVLRGHHGEAMNPRQAFEARTPDDQHKVEEFLKSL